MIERLAAELGRHYVAGNLEAEELDARLGLEPTTRTRHYVASRDADQAGRAARTRSA